MGGCDDEPENDEVFLHPWMVTVLERERIQEWRHPAVRIRGQQRYRGRGGGEGRRERSDWSIEKGRLP